MGITIEKFLGQYTAESDTGSLLGLFRASENIAQEGQSSVPRRPGMRDSGVLDPGSPYIAIHCVETKDNEKYFLGWAVDGKVYAWTPTVVGQLDTEVPFEVADFSNSDSGAQANNGQYKPVFETIKNVVYMSDGVSDIRVFTGLHKDSSGNLTTYRAGSPEAQQDWADTNQTDITVTGGTGSISAGNHLIRYRYFNDVEGQPGKVSNQITKITAANDKVTFTVKDGNDGKTGFIPMSEEIQIDKIVVEATTDGGSVFFEIGQVLNQDGATLEWVSSDTELGENTILYPVEEDDAVHGRPVPCRLMKADKEIMFYLSDSNIGVDLGGLANNGTVVSEFKSIVDAGTTLAFDRVETSVDTNYGTEVVYPGDATTEAGYAAPIPRSKVKPRILVLGNRRFGGLRRTGVMAYVQRMRIENAGIWQL